MEISAWFCHASLGLLAVCAVALMVISLSSCAGYTTAAKTQPATGGAGSGVLTASSTSVSFGNVAIGSSATQSLSVTNTGTATVNVSQVTISGAGFRLLSGSSATAIAVGQSATVQIQFAPQSAGAASGTLTATSDASNSPLAIGLSGTGTQGGLSATPSSVNFGSVVVGTSNSQAMILKNTGTASLTITQVSVTGAGFSQTGLSAQTVAAGASVAFNAVFTPAAGSASGSISITSNAPGSPLAIALSGTGVAATYAVTASPTSLSFGSVNMGSSSSLSVTLKNTGNANITISSVAVSGAGFSANGVVAGTTLTPSQSTTLNVVFAPAAAGSVSGTVTVNSNASSPATVSVSGSGVQPTTHSVALSWTASTSSGVTGYHVYRGTVSGGPYAMVSSSLVAATQFTDTTVQSSQTYYYAVTAVDSSNAESAYSNQATVTIP